MKVLTINRSMQESVLMIVALNWLYSQVNETLINGYTGTAAMKVSLNLTSR